MTSQLIKQKNRTRGEARSNKIDTEPAQLTLADMQIWLTGNLNCIKIVLATVATFKSSDFPGDFSRFFREQGDVGGVGLAAGNQ